jgi:hypothetical protein
MHRFLKILIALVVINGAVFLLFHPWNGTALNGKVEDGRYYVGSHDNYHEVSCTTYNFCIVEEYSGMLTLLLLFPVLWFVPAREKKTATIVGLILLFAPLAAHAQVGIVDHNWCLHIGDARFGAVQVTYPWPDGTYTYMYCGKGEYHAHMSAPLLAAVTVLPLAAVVLALTLIRRRTVVDGLDAKADSQPPGQQQSIQI